MMALDNNSRCVIPSNKKKDPVSIYFISLQEPAEWALDVAMDSE